MGERGKREKSFFIVNVKCNGLIMKMPKNIVELSAILRRQSERVSGRRICELKGSSGAVVCEKPESRLGIVWNMNYDGENLKALCHSLGFSSAAESRMTNHKI